MKKEKYIVQNDRYLRIKFRLPDGGYFSQNVRIKDYPSPAKAMAAAVAIRDRALAQKSTGRLVSSSPTVQQVYDRLPDLFGYSQKTIKRHQIMFDAAIRKYAADEITEVKTSDVMECVTAYSLTHSDQATDRLLSLWSVIFEAAQIMDIPVPNRAKAVRKLRPRSKVPTAKRAVMAPDADIEKFLDTLATYGTKTEKGQYKAKVLTMLAQIMIHTGCRPAEALALRRSDVDLIHSEISITKSVGSTPTSSGRSIRTTKTEQSIRRIPLDSEIRGMLIEFLQWQNHDFILSDYDGNLMEIDNVSNHMRLVSKKAGVRVTLYMFRHKFSTDMIRVADIRTVQDLMGHESSSMTLAYARSSEEDRKHAIDKRKLS